MTLTLNFVVILMLIASVCVASGLSYTDACSGSYPDDCGGPGFQHTLAWNEAHGHPGVGVTIPPYSISEVKTW